MAYPETMKGEGDIPGTVQRIASDPFFHAIEVTWIRDAAARARVKHILASSHMTVAYGAQPRLLTQKLNINDLNAEGRRKALDTLLEGVDEALELGSSSFAFLSGTYNPDSIEDSYQALAASTRELCSYARSRGNLPVLLEVFDFDVDKKSLIGPVSLARRFAEEIAADHENFGLLVDLSHIPLLRETARQAILPVREFIRHAHMGNCVVRDPLHPAYGDAHPRFGIPGGENDVDELAEYLRVLLEAGVLNTSRPPVLSFEVKPMAGEDPEVVIAGSKRVLDLAWAKV
jgi:sugar phosphate isomerase/epimerase